METRRNLLGLPIDFFLAPRRNEKKESKLGLTFTFKVLLTMW
jgi:hypothetical protein